MRARPPRATSIADATRAYIDEHPSIREALRDDLVNFTLLARKIQSELSLPNEEAITIACRRYQRSLLAPDPGESPIRAIVGKSRLEVHARVGLIRLRHDFDTLDRLLSLGHEMLADPGRRPLFQVFEGTRAVTVLCAERLLAPLLRDLPSAQVIHVERSLASLAFRSQPEVADTPGVVAYMAMALFRAGVNTLETVSVHTDSIFVFRDDDVIRAYQVLSNLAGEAEPLGESRSQHARGTGAPDATVR